MTLSDCDSAKSAQNDNHPLQFPLHTTKPPGSQGGYLLEIMEARVGIEPTHKGFADLSLTTWVPRLAAHTRSASQCRTHRLTCGVYRRMRVFWSGRPGSNRRHLPWQGSTLPLSYSRPAMLEYTGRQRGFATQRSLCNYCGVGVPGYCGAAVPGGEIGRCGAPFWGCVPVAGWGGGGGGNCSSIVKLCAAARGS